MNAPLPSQPSFENLRKQAKTLKRAWQAGEAEALQRIRAMHPRFTETAVPRLADCQLVLAREASFTSWKNLKVGVELANQELGDRFVNLACLCYDDPHFDHRSFHRQAHKMLRDTPWVAEANIWAAAAAGNSAGVAAFLQKEPQLANRPGLHGWVPLLCACYSRIRSADGGGSTLEAARVLLDRGALPNAFTMKGNADERLDQKPRRFTALTGLFGGGPTGMANQPAHPYWRELGQLLLERGADPNDREALQISQDPAGTYGKLELLVRYGLSPEAMGYAVPHLIMTGNAEGLELVLQHGARTDEPNQGRTPWVLAMERGQLSMARMLEDAGARTTQLSEVERFVSLCVAAEVSEARAMLRDSPDLLERAPKQLVLKCVNGGAGRQAVELALDLGFDPNYLDEITALHGAAGKDDFETVRLLLLRGAKLTMREPFYDGTPIGWADFFDRREMCDMLLSEGEICLFDALDFNKLDRVPDVLARDPGALNRPFAECLTRLPRPEDWQTPLERMRARGNEEAVELLRARGATG